MSNTTNKHAYIFLTPSQVIAELTRMEQRMKERGIYPVRDGVDLATTCMQTMMDANLALQIRMASGGDNTAPHNAWAKGASWPTSWSSLKVRCSNFAESKHQLVPSQHRCPHSPDTCPLLTYLASLLATL